MFPPIKVMDELRKQREIEAQALQEMRDEQERRSLRTLQRVQARFQVVEKVIPGESANPS